MESNTTINNLHPCQYCGNPCRGKQCKECHLKMVNNKQGNCIDCKKTFYALRSDGTKRQRCFDCQNNYNLKHICKCPICNIDYHAFLEDGRVFDKCFKCYQENLTECKNCSKKISNNQPLCRQCYHNEKNNLNLLSINDSKLDDEYENTYKTHERTCRTKNCMNITKYTYCKDCYIKNKQNNNIFSICESCTYKGIGKFKLCEDCS